MTAQRVLGAVTHCTKNFSQLRSVTDEKLFILAVSFEGLCGFERNAAKPREQHEKIMAETKTECPPSAKLRTDCLERRSTGGARRAAEAEPLAHFASYLRPRLSELPPDFPGLFSPDRTRKMASEIDTKNYTLREREYGVHKSQLSVHPEDSFMADCAITSASAAHPADPSRRGA